MKKASRLLSLLILVGVATLMTNCDKDNENSKTVEQQQLEKLVGEWSLVSAMDEVAPDRTEHFADMVLKIEGTYSGEGKTYNYSLTGSRPNPSPWPGSGTWKFGTNKATEIIRDPASPSEILMNYVVSGSTLTLTFTLPDGADGWLETGRVKNVTGDWTFTFEK